MKNCFHENLKNARINAGMSQADLADRLGVARSTYSLYESGKREPGILKIKALADILGVSGDMLLGVPSADPVPEPAADPAPVSDVCADLIRLAMSAHPDNVALVLAMLRKLEGIS